MRSHHRIIAYTVLTSLLAGAGILAYLFRYDPLLQFQILLLTVFAYLAWGFGYHWWEKSISPTIVVEYILIGGLAITVIFALTMWR